MNRLLNFKQAKILALVIAYSFLAIHVILLLLFLKCGVTPMAYFNVGSILFYILVSIVTIKGKLKLFVLTTYLEVVLHMSFVVYFCGWESGFQVPLLGICVLTAYAEYVGRYLKIDHIRATPLNLIALAAYLAICVISHHHGAPYPLPENVIYISSLAWGLITFGIVLVYLHFFVRITVDTEEILAHAADHDYLTQLPNRHYILNMIDELQRSGRLEGRWVAMIDVDHFKETNDTYGHNCGDFILKELAELIRNCGFTADVCRWGGEEFLFTGEILGDYGARVAELDAFRKIVEAHAFIYAGNVLRITVTVGMAAYSGGSPEEWIGAADRKMYEGKRRGKNCVIS